MTLDEIAAKYGWTLTVTGERATTEYKFRKGPLTVRFSRAGYGSLYVYWRTYRVGWRPSFEVNGKHHSPPLVSREEYAAGLLPQVTEEEALRRIEAAFRGSIEEAELKLRRAKEDLDEFLAAKSKA